MHQPFVNKENKALYESGSPPRIPHLIARNILFPKEKNISQNDSFLHTDGDKKKAICMPTNRTVKSKRYRSSPALLLDFSHKMVKCAHSHYGLESHSEPTADAYP
jgi:hypothetical protein